MAAETTIPTALDVAVELVATKVALLHVLEDVTGTSPIDPTEQLQGWAIESPVPLPQTEDGYGTDGFLERLSARTDEIEAQMLAALGEFFTAKAERLSETRSQHGR